MDNNTSYETQAIDINLLSVLDITKDGKVVSAEKWVELWNLVFQHINKIDAFCVDMQSTLDNWHESEIALNEIIGDMQMKYDALSTGFIHYGENTPKNPHIMLWVRRMNDISTHGFITNEDVDSELSSTSENPVQNKVVTEAVSSRVPKKSANPGASFPSVLATSNGSYDEYRIPTDDSYMCIDTIGAELGKDIDNNGTFINSIPRRDSKGNLFTGTPVDNEDCVNKKYVDEKTIVDQTYNAQSENAQSGKAVAEAIANTAILKTETTYVPEDGKIPRYSKADTIRSGPPKNSDDCANKKYVDEKTIADQTYNAESENAQSGKAVAEAINNKVPKVAERGNLYPKALAVKSMPELENIDGILYPKNSDYKHLNIDDGYSKYYPAPEPPDVSITKGFIATRDTSTGNLWTGIPVADVDCANKKYVDEKTVVDQTYNSNSLNAQSGKAVAEVANKRMPKVINAYEETAVVTVKGYTGDSMAGTEDSRYSCVVMSETNSLTGDFSVVNKSIPVRDSKGNLQSGDPVKDYDVAPKKYVDDALAQSGGDPTLNIKNSTGSSSLQQVQDTGYTGIAIKTKNHHAYILDSTLTDNEPIGATGAFASSFGGASSAQGKRSLAEGTNTVAKGKYSHVEGDNSVALGNDSHAEGYATVSKGQASHAEGTGTQAQGDCSHSEGNGTIANGQKSHSEGELSKALGEASHSEGVETQAIGTYSHSENFKSIAKGNASHAEGFGTKANGNSSHAEGHFTEATGEAAHSEGANTKAIGDLSHSEGENTQSTGRNSHAEGWVTIAEGVSAHAEGWKTHAKGENSHTQNRSTVANGNSSSAAGIFTIANYEGQFVIGKRNENKADTLFEVGNGADANNRSNAFEVYADGHAEISAMGSTDKSITTKKYVDDKIAEIPSGGGETWEVISDTTTEFDTPVSQIVINQDTNGNSFSLKKMRVFIDFTVSEAYTGGIARALTASSGLMYIVSQSFSAGSVYGYFIDSEVLPMVNNRCQIISHFNDTRMSENGNNFNFEYNSGSVDYAIRAEKMTVTTLGYNVSSISNLDFRLGSNGKINKARILIFGVRS